MSGVDPPGGALETEAGGQGNARGEQPAVLQAPGPEAVLLRHRPASRACGRENDGRDLNPNRGFVARILWNDSHLPQKMEKIR